MVRRPLCSWEAPGAKRIQWRDLFWLSSWDLLDHLLVCLHFFLQQLTALGCSKPNTWNTSSCGHYILGRRGWWKKISLIPLYSQLQGLATSFAISNSLPSRSSLRSFSGINCINLFFLWMGHTLLCLCMPCGVFLNWTLQSNNELTLGTDSLASIEMLF